MAVTIMAQKLLHSCKVTEGLYEICHSILYRNEVLTMLSYGIDLIGYDNLAKKHIGKHTVWVKETCSTIIILRQGVRYVSLVRENRCSAFFQ
jgi:hypothetical protein